MSLARTAARVVLGTLMVGAGVSHLTVSREEFQAQVPSWFPVDRDVTVLGPASPRSASARLSWRSPAISGWSAAC
nr:hypothetical protein [Nocardioides caldifontis]